MSTLTTAWWVPGNKDPYRNDVITRTQGKSGSTYPDDPVSKSMIQDSVSPAQLVVQGQFMFSVTGQEPLISIALTLLNQALEQAEYFSRGHVGYGPMQK